MAQALCELVALCLGFVGLIGVAAVTGMPMWRVTAFIGENIIIMETRWEGLWMNCFRQANIRMQCKVYDSLLYLPPDLQAARGLTCCALALSGIGLLVSLLGLQCMSCLRDEPRFKTIALLIAGTMQVLASICLLIPVSWTANTVIRDFYNPLLMDAQRRELGEALYVGWVTSAFLMASGVIFLCRRIDPKPNPVLPFTHQPLLQNNGFSSSPATAFSYAITPSGGQHSSYNAQPLVYNQNLFPPQNQSFYTTNGMPSHVSQSPPYPSQLSSNFKGDLYTSVTTMSAFEPVPQNPVFVGYQYSRVQSDSSHSSPGLRI